jgi:hypothetical protein
VPTLVLMAAGTFEELVNRIEEIGGRVAAESGTTVTLTRDELVDMLDLIHRVGKAMLVLQARGKLR